MSFQENAALIVWRLHLNSTPGKVYQALSTDAGRASFWAESAVEQNGFIQFKFPNGISWDGRVITAEPPRRYALLYYGGSTATFSLEEDGHGGTDLTLVDEGVAADDRIEVIAGWVSVLMSLKAAVDFGVDLRTHDPLRTWDHGYVEN